MTYIIILAMGVCYYRGKIEDFTRDFNDGKSFASHMKSAHIKFTGSEVEEGQYRAWEESYEYVKKLFEELKRKNLGGVECIFEYVFPVIQRRMDLILIGSKEGSSKLVVIEFKGHRELYGDNKGNYSEKDRALEQLVGYINMIKNFHSEASRFHIAGILWFYNLSDELVEPNIKNIYVFSGANYADLAEKIVDYIDGPPQEEELEAFLRGQYKQGLKLFEFFKNEGARLLKEGGKAFYAYGFIPSESQCKIKEEILEKLKKDEGGVFFIRGGPGSGKTYLALSLWVASFKMGKQTALAYKNNRIVETLSYIVSKIDKEGTTKKNTPVDYFIKLADSKRESTFDLIIYDEAQRMTEQTIRNALSKKDKIKVFIYDDNQILLPSEAGWTENFIKIAGDLKIDFHLFELHGYLRVKGGEKYHQFVEELLEGKSPTPNFEDYEFCLFEDIRDMLGALREKTEKHRVALVAAFTESPGDWKKPLEKTLLNRRVGYPLCSGFDLYKDMDLDIYWAMDNREQYPKFWIEGLSNELNLCSSIYGCQSFEVDYVGVIWGRDLVWRDSCWTLGDNCTDSVEGEKSLQKLFERAKEDRNTQAQQLALKLLQNRYRIFLTRGIHGTYIFCEDKETANYLKSLLNRK